MSDSLREGNRKIGMSVTALSNTANCSREQPRRDAMNRRQFLQCSGVGVGAVLGAGCTLFEAPDAPTRITMVDRPRYKPSRIIIESGTAVTWVNKSKTPYTVTAYENRIPATAEYFASGGFESEHAARTNTDAGVLEHGDTFAYTFTEPGAYWYFSIPHESTGMIGIVQVK